MELQRIVCGSIFGGSGLVDGDAESSSLAVMGFFNFDAYGFFRDFSLERSYSAFMVSHLDKTRFRVTLICATHFNGTRIKVPARYESPGAPTAARLHAASGKSKQGPA